MGAAMKRLALILLLVVIAYGTAGVAVYLSDIARAWCNVDFSPEALGWYAIIWPLRLIAPAALCD
jgi:hypothetical protein